MTASRTAARVAPVLDAAARMRILSRLTTAYVLDSIAIVRGDSDPIDALLASAVIQANVAEITHRAELQAAFVERDEMPSDEMRRPVSMSAIAASLNLPVETVRRRINAMVKTGHCKAVDGGVIVPVSTLSDPQHYVGAFRGYERLRAFYYQLRTLGMLDDLPPPDAAVDPAKFPVRTLSRLVGAYLLRVVESLGAVGDLIDAYLLLHIFRANVEDLREPHAPLLPDPDRKPIAPHALAIRAGLPSETVRRRVLGLAASGDCLRVPGGVIVPHARLQAPRLAGAMASNAANLQRLFATLSRLGVLKVWDSMEPHPA